MQRDSKRGFSRRQVLQMGAGALALAGLGTPVHAADKKIPIGVQLYSVRDVCGKDPAGTIAAIAKMGYAGVEFAGYCGKNAVELKKILDDNGLKCCGTHTGLNTLMGDQLKATIEFNRTLGNPYLIVPGLPKERLATAESVKETAKLFTDLAAQLKEQQMHTGYHAHGGDFEKIEGTTKWELLFDAAGPDVVMQMDTSNAMGAGADPVALLKKYPGRALTIHLKEHGGAKGAVIGEGKVDLKSIFEICESTGGTQWYIVEHESSVTTSMESIKGCVDALKKMGK